MKRVYLILLCTILLSGGCKKDSALSGAGTSFTYPLYGVLLENYYSQTGNRVLYKQTNTDLGMRAFHDKVVDFTSIIYLSSDEIEQSSDEEILYIPCLIGATVLAYNLPGIDSLNLDASTIMSIYSGKAKYWNDPEITRLNPHLRLDKTPITPIFRTDNAGSYFILTEYLSNHYSIEDKAHSWNESLQTLDGIGVKGNESVASNITKIAGSIGYIGVEYASLLDLSTAAILNSSGKYVKATTQSISKATNIAIPDDMRILITDSSNPEAYPVSTLCWILVYKNQKYNKRNIDKKESLVSFLHYLISPEVQKKAVLMGYSPLPESMIEKADKLINSIEY